MFQSFRFNLRRFFSRSPFLFHAIYALAPYNKIRMVQEKTDIVIEGFPRSGNTFTVFAFKQAQIKEPFISHHLHSQSQIIKACKNNVPTCVLIRNPKDAVSSLVIKYPQISPKDALKAYIEFYKDILPFKNQFVIAPYEKAIHQLDQVIKQINQKFKTEFIPFEHSTEKLTEVKKTILEIDQKVNKNRENKRTEPSPIKEKLKKELSFAPYREELQEAESIYYEYVSS